MSYAALGNVYHIRDITPLRDVRLNRAKPSTNADEIVLIIC